MRVVGAPDEARGMIVKAYVVLAGGAKGDAALTQRCRITSSDDRTYKYPRAIEYVRATAEDRDRQAQRFALRQMARPARRRQASRGITLKLDGECR